MSAAGRQTSYQIVNAKNPLFPKGAGKKDT